MAFFFFGTLMDDDVLAAVLARPVAVHETAPARLRGFERVASTNATYPVLRPAEQGGVDGRVLLEPSPRDVLRILHFESEEYEAEWLTVDVPEGTRPARVFLALETMQAGTEAWTLEHWARRHKEEYLRLCEHWMSDSPT
ncbi:gamma-glutamylcyclotransferase family protein [Marinivivus vitaminiproducens]|uniref:gamma-glutamylcyclotransferase family protein n=1 Tax=Marinivivus vitaminiproducens TaxID=3035935 RepID=UPI0027A79710|nr:gamma-glutamylcyclotransferase [Geminicoccaceae bacterium SCSIO 64248]